MGFIRGENIIVITAMVGVSKEMAIGYDAMSVLYEEIYVGYEAMSVVNEAMYSGSKEMLFGCKLSGKWDDSITEN